MLIIVFLLLIVFPFARNTNQVKKREREEQLIHTRFKRYEYDDYGHNWPQKYESCGGRRQSPININSKKTKKLSSSKTYEFSKAYQSFPKKMYLSIKNNSLRLGFDYGKKSKPTVRGTGSDGSYKLNHVVFHWGEYSRGTEHTINNYIRSLEVQLVHINSKYKNFKESIKHDKGVFIYSSLFKPEDKGGTAGIELLSHELPDYSKESGNKKYRIPSFPISWLMSGLDSYYIYEGSITYPPCSEVVTWMISSHSPNVTKEQLRRFRKLYEKREQLRHNIRPQQKWNGRTIYKRN